jgi:two-component system response regulator HydG
LEDSEKRTIEKILRQTSFNKKKTAETLGISRNTLYKKIQKYGLS